MKQRRESSVEEAKGRNGDFKNAEIADGSCHWDSNEIELLNTFNITIELGSYSVILMSLRAVLEVQWRRAKAGKDVGFSVRFEKLGYKRMMKAIDWSSHMRDLSILITWGEEASKERGSKEQEKESLR